jgi:hypothetical protein
MSTAATSTDKKVKKYVSAIGAVQKVLPRLVHISSPREGDTYEKGSIFTFNAFAFDPGGASPSYTWKNGGQTLGTGPTISTDLPYGAATITVTATFPSGQAVSDTRHITIKNTPPSLSIKQPANGATFFQGEQVQLKSDSGDLNQPADGYRLRPEQIAWTLDSTSFATGEDPTLDLTGVPVGVHTIFVRGTDDAGAVGSAVVQINVAEPPPNLPPSVKITSPADGSFEDACCTEPPPDGRSYGTWNLQSDVTDPEGDPLTYTWTEKILPNGTPETVSTVEDPGVSHIHAGGCTDQGTKITLTVSDGVTTRSDSVTIGYNLVC